MLTNYLSSSKCARCIVIALCLLLTLIAFSPSPFPAKAVRPNCDLFKGKWVPLPPSAPPLLYNNRTCGSLPSSRNCLLHGRPDTGFLRWRWAPDGPGCGLLLPGFDALGFLRLVQGKTAAFVGDSLARNQADSLLCMLATVYIPVNVYQDRKDRSRTWYFPTHNFTLMVLWTKFLVKHKERGINGYPTGIFDLHIDQLDVTWSTEFQQNRPLIHYAIISDSQWFFRENYLYENNQLLGCTYCNDTTTKNLSPVFAIRRALRTSLGHIATIQKTEPSLRGIVTLVRTISPSHFEGGTWKTGGRCEKKRPMRNDEVAVQELMNDGLDWEVRKAQLEEVERAKEGGKGLGLVFEVLDITLAMLMRPDGHPNNYWREKRKSGYNDCVHWCLPGPIDTWNDLLLALLRKVNIYSEKY